MKCLGCTFDKINVKKKKKVHVMTYKIIQC